MPKKLTEKSIKGRAELHPRSRKLAQLARSIQRKHALKSKRKSDVVARRHPMVDMLTWWQLRADEDKVQFSKEEIQEMLGEYLERHRIELEELETKACYPGRPKPPKINLLGAAMEREMNEAKSAGLLIPDLTKTTNVAALRAWDGSYDAIGRVALSRFVFDPK